MVFTAKFFLFLALGFLPILGGTMHPHLFWFGIAYDAGVLIVAIIDYRLLSTRTILRVQRTCPSVVSIGVPFDVGILVENVSPHPLRLAVKDSPPHEFHAPSRLVTLQMAPYAANQRVYTVRANVRGIFQFQEIFYRVRGITGLCEKQVKLPRPATIKVYPNVKN